MFKVNKKDTITTHKPELETYFTPCSNVSIVNFGHVNADWDGTRGFNSILFCVYSCEIFSSEYDTLLTEVSLCLCRKSVTTTTMVFSFPFLLGEIYLCLRG